MTHFMTKPAFAICKQQRRRSACTSAQSNQRLCVRCLDCIIPLVSITEISSLCLASLAAQAGWSFTWSQTPKTGFLVTRFIYEYPLWDSNTPKVILKFVKYYLISHLYICIDIVTYTLYLIQSLSLNVRRGSTDIEDLTRVVSSYEIYETSLRRVS